jgi:integrase/recombinase XerD
MKRHAKRRGGELVATDASTAELIPAGNRKSLGAWFALYLRVEAEPGSQTFEAMRRDLQAFFDFFRPAIGSNEVEVWTPAITKAFQRQLAKKKKATTVNRVLATLRHASAWIHRHHPFPAGKPCAGTHDLQTDEPSWKGLGETDVTRLRAAAQQLLALKKRKNQRPVRDHAIFLLLLHTGLRVSELLALDLSQYTGKHFENVRRKGRKVSARVFVPTEAREPLDRYLEEVRGDREGPLFLAKGGGRLLRQNVDDLLKALANQANARLKDEEKIRVSAHVLRHTMLRRAAEKHGVQYAMEMAGHTSHKYIWRYVKPTDEQREKAAEELFESESWERSL